MSTQTKEATHTPGPWRVDFEDDPYSFEIQKDDVALGCVYGPDDFPCIDEENIGSLVAECAANARLIAAAPGLLSAAQEALDYFEREFTDDDEPLVARVLRAAINKTTEQPST